jgi:hypothetical protein
MADQQDQQAQQDQAAQDEPQDQAAQEAAGEGNAPYVEASPPGEPVPPEVFPAEMTDTGNTADTGVQAVSPENEGAPEEGVPGNPNPGETDMSGESTFDVDNASRQELEAETQRLGLVVEGTGAGGRVLVDDLRNALRSHMEQQ